MSAATSFSKKLAYDDILSAKYSTSTLCRCLEQCSCLQAHQLVIMSFSRHPKKPWLWRQQHYTLGAPHEDTARDWAARINSRVKLNPERPQNLLVFLNPKSGSRAARSVWEGVVRPILEAGRIKFTCLETLHKDHAKDMVASMKLEELKGYHGLVAVGGDGLFQELLAGLLARRANGGPASSSSQQQQQQQGQQAQGDTTAFEQRLRIGHIPAGSTDAVACTLHGTRSAETAALHIAVGDRTALDVMRLDTGAGQQCYSVCQAGYGFMGDVMHHSESLRWLGPVRYDISGALQFATLRSYHASVSFRPAPLPMSMDRSLSCGHRCDICRAASLTSRPPGSEPFLPPSPSSSSSSPPASPASDAPLPEGWQSREGEFTSIMCVVTPCRSDKSPSGVVPMGHLADGAIYLVLVRRCSRLQYLQFLLALSQTGVAPGQFPWVEVVAVTALRVAPGGGPASRWNVDGELYEGGEVRAAVFRGLVEVFGRGVEMQAPDRTVS